MNCNRVIKSLQGSLRDYVTSNDLKSLVIGISGGIDSAATAAVARPVCDFLGIPLIGRSITIVSNKPDEIARALAVGEAFCTDFKEADLSDSFHLMVKELLEDDEPGDLTFGRKVRRGNLKARMRMIRLYDLASKNRGMVLSTDNLTELLLGFWTICGDVGDYGMFQHCWKSEVYALAHALVRTYESDKMHERAEALRRCERCEPTDGLGITSTDLDQLGADSYDEVERILKIWKCDDEDKFAWDNWLKWEGRPSSYEELQKMRAETADHTVVKRNIATKFKRNVPIHVSRYDIDGLDA